MTFDEVSDMLPFLSTKILSITQSNKLNTSPVFFAFLEGPPRFQQEEASVHQSELQLTGPSPDHDPLVLGSRG